MPFFVKRSVCAIGVLLCSLTTSRAQSTLPDWENPEVISKNTERPRTSFTPYPSEKEALAAARNSTFVQSLNDTWKFKWVSHPSKIPADFFQPTTSTDFWDNLPVPSNWQVVGAREGRAYDLSLIHI